MNSDVQAVDARVSIDRENSDIREITIVFNAANGDGDGRGGHQAANSTNEDLGVQPVVVDLDGKSAADEPSPVKAATPEQKKAAVELTAVVAQFYNLKPDQVKYEFLE
jgi:stage III sporulation protein AF